MFPIILFWCSFYTAVKVFHLYISFFKKLFLVVLVFYLHSSSRVHHNVLCVLFIIRPIDIKFFTLGKVWNQTAWWNMIYSSSFILYHSCTRKLYFTIMISWCKTWILNTQPIFYKPSFRCFLSEKVKWRHRKQQVIRAKRDVNDLIYEDAQKLLFSLRALYPINWYDSAKFLLQSNAR